MADQRRYRVVQWATGNIGLRSLQAVIEHPLYDLVGLYVSSDQKVGRDAGELCGLPPVGVKATNSIEDILAAKPDCVLYMREGFDVGELTRLLSAGVNIVTTRTEFHHPPTLDEGLRSAIEQACTAGGASLYGTGSSPGFITEAVTIPFLSLQRRLDLLTIDEFADMSSRNSPHMIFQLMGYGAPVESFDERRAAHMEHGFAGTIRQIGDAIGLPIDSLETTAEVAAATRDVEIAAGTIPAGTIAAQRLSLTGLHKGRPVLRQRVNWYCAKAIDKEWDLRESGWRVRVDGDTPLDVSFTFPVAPENYAAMTPGLTAHRAVNAVPEVVAAAPGIRTTVDLPHIIAHLG